MKTIELLEKINNGEDSYTQFKEMPIRSQTLAREMVAFSNSEGGIIIYIKYGSDKKIISQPELKRLFAQSSNLYADEEIIFNTSINDLNKELFYEFLEKEDLRIYEELQNGQLSLVSILENRELLRDSHLTLAGNLIFGKIPQRFSKSFYIDYVYFNGNDVTVNNFIAKDIIKGTFGELYKQSLLFLKSSLRKVQVETNFNSLGKLEINEIILSELIVNALVHRDYYINSSIKIFIFDNRIEIINPGKLANSLTVDKIKSGISIHRNPILSSISKYILPYSGYGSGIKRVLKLDPTIEFINDIEKEEFKVIIYRK